MDVCAIADEVRESGSWRLARYVHAISVHITDQQRPLQAGAMVGLRHLMGSGRLAGEPLAFCDRQKIPKLTGRQQPDPLCATPPCSQHMRLPYTAPQHRLIHSILCSTGVVSEAGLITCGCKMCAPVGVSYSASEWEVHAGSRERRPAESIYLTDYGISLRVRGRLSLRHTQSTRWLGIVSSLAQRSSDSGMLAPHTGAVPGAAERRIGHVSHRRPAAAAPGHHLHHLRPRCAGKLCPHRPTCASLTVCGSVQADPTLAQVAPSTELHRLHLLCSGPVDAIGVQIFHTKSIY